MATLAAQTELITTMEATMAAQTATIDRQRHELRGLRRAQGQHLYRR